MKLPKAVVPAAILVLIDSSLPIANKHFILWNLGFGYTTSAQSVVYQKGPGPRLGGARRCRLYRPLGSDEFKPRRDGQLHNFVESVAR